MAFWVASSDAAGFRLPDSTEQLDPAPVEVDYPQEPAGNIVEGTGVKQQPARDPRRRAWIWQGLPSYSQNPRYLQLIRRLESLLSTTRRARNLSPWIFLKDDTSDAFRTWQFDSGTATAVGASSLTDGTESWAVDVAKNGVLEIASATTGAGQRRTVASNTATVLSLTEAFNPTPTGTVTYSLQYPVSGWIRCRVLGVFKTPVSRGGISYESIKMEFFVDDPSFTALD